MKKLAFLALCACVVFLAACGGNTAKPGNGGNTAGGHGHEHGGAKKDHGKKKIGNYDVALVQYGDADKGGEAIFEINTGATPEANQKLKIYVWIGDKDGKEISPKITPAWAKEHNGFDGHVEVPKNAPDKAMVWVEIDGAKAGWDIEIHAD